MTELSQIGRTQARSVEPAPARLLATVDLKAIRRASGMTLQVFAFTYGFTLGALRDREQGRKRTERTATVLLRVIAQMPDAVARAVAGT